MGMEDELEMIIPEVEAELKEPIAFKPDKLDTLHLHLWKDLHAKLQVHSTDL